MKLYNSLTRQKEEFKPLGKVVKMYTCGPTVYGTAHIGNMRAYIFMDELRRVLKYNGFEVNGVINITDVGHLTSDEDEGDDKMLVASKREKKSPWEIAKFYTQQYLTDIKKLNIDMPQSIIPATSVIEEIIEFVKGLMQKGYAYETSKGVYFDIAKFKNYGQLSGVKLEDKIMGARIEVDEEKRNPADFALWIKAPKEHIMQWQSPWGMGYPGWHIECSAIGRKFFGDSIDIHTGGIDHKTVHHENEIAQNDALNGHKTVNFWVHCEFIQVDGAKMSKSLGNLYTIAELENKGYSAMDYRYLLLTSHYSKPSNFTFEALTSAKNALNQLKNLANEHKNGSAVIEKETLAQYDADFFDAVSDDLNIPQALGIVWQMLKNQTKSKQVYDLLTKFNQVLGFDLEQEKIEIPQEIKDLAETRWQAKQNKNFAESDRQRKEIESKGFAVLDSKDGYEIVKK
ncbi:MAG: cysteine--tRNA ligase [Clostridia bacterium]|nr:cysteine--tRNA ligase [Clostridia bacterium]